MSMEVRGEGVRASADSKLLNMLQRKLLFSKELLKCVAKLLLSAEAEVSHKDLMEEVGKVKKRVEEVRWEFLEYFSKVALLLYNREEWLRIFSKISGIVDKLNGIAYRAEYMFAKGLTIQGAVKEQLTSMCNALSSMLDEFNYMSSVTLVDVNRALDARKRIVELEAKLDSNYRASAFTILEAGLPPHFMILLLNTAEMLEDIADTLNSAADDVYLIAFSLKQ